MTCPDREPKKKSQKLQNTYYDQNDKMGFRTFLVASFNLLALLHRNKAWAAISLEEILQQCEESGMTAEDCQTLIGSNGHVADITVVSAHHGVDAEDYFQVELFVDYRGYVLGRPPDFDARVTYPYEWRGDPSHQIGTRPVGPWDCKGLIDTECCEVIETDVPDPDINGNYLSCVMQEAFYEDPITNQLFGVYVNPVDMSIHYLTADHLNNLEDREEGVRSALISDINATIGNKNCPKSMLQKIHASFLHSMRGVPKARPFPKYTKNAIRNMNNAGIDILDVTKDADLQYALPLMQMVVDSVSKNGGLHRLADTKDGYVVLQLPATNTSIHVVGHYRSVSDPTREPDDVVKCLTENADNLSACQNLLDGVKVITVHPRSITDNFYNQVVIPIDYRGVVLGSQPNYDGEVTYKFEWRGNEADGLGVRRVGPWDCKGLTDVQCCDKVQTSVPDLDTEGNFIDCWFEESFYKDPFTKKISKIFYNDATGAVEYASNEDVASFQLREDKARTKLIADIDSVLHMTNCSKDTLWSLYARIRHDVRGNAEVQGDPQIIRDVLNLHSGNTLDVTQNVFLQTVLPKISKVLLSTTTMRNVTPNENIVVVVVDNNSTRDVSRIGGSA